MKKKEITTNYLVSLSQTYVKNGRILCQLYSIDWGKSVGVKWFSEWGRNWMDWQKFSILQEGELK